MRVHRDQAGAAAVEFALVLPFLIILLCVIMDFGRGYYMRIALHHAAREGVRAWAVTDDRPAAEARALAAANGIAGTTAAASPCTFGRPTTMVVRAPLRFVTPLVSDVAPDLRWVEAEGSMRCER